MTDTASIATILTGRDLGKRWTKSLTLDRVYISHETLLRLAGYAYPAEGTSYSTLDGEGISNNHARQIREAITSSKVYFDIPAAKWVLQIPPLHRDGEAAIKRAYQAIQAEVAEVLA